MSKFIGRNKELNKLEEFTKKKTASLLVVRGRRRIGKSRLIEEFAKEYNFYAFSGFPPEEKTTAQSQRDEFAIQLSSQTGLPEIKADDWSKLFLLLAEKIKAGQIIVLFDEISWIGIKDPNFLGKLKNAWDLYFKKNPKLILILCGSASFWIEKNISSSSSSSTGFLGRISHTFTLEELQIIDCVKFWGNIGKNISAIEKLKILSVIGGVPKYLEEINPHLSAEENIKNLCFTKGGLLVNEFDNIFSSLFSHRSNIYKKIVTTLANGSKDTSKICELLNIRQTGRVTEYLQELQLSGFIERDYTWDLASGQDTKLSNYRLKDNYLRFYLKYISKYITKIQRNSYQFKTLTSLPAWDTILGLQFENLVLNNRNYIHQKLGLRAEDIIAENPFFQRKTLRQSGCQIDYMIQTKFNCLYICEIKFSKHQIGAKIINEVQQKIDRIKRPKNFSCRPVLIHVNSIHQDTIDSDYFATIIDFSKLLES